MSDLPLILELKDFNNRTPLSRAAEIGDTDAIDELLDQGANVHSADLTGKTSLFWAAIRDQPRSIKTLIAHGAEWRVEDSSGRSPLSYAAELKHYDTCWALVTADAEKLQASVHDDGVDSDSSNGDNNSTGHAENGDQSSQCSESSSESIILPLTYAVSREDEQSVKILLEFGMDMHWSCAWEDDPKPIAVAAKSGNSEILTLLLGAGFPVLGSVDMYCRTPLIHAAARGHDSVVRILLAQSDTDPEDCDDDGDDALAHARRNGHGSTVQILMEAGLKDRDQETSSAGSLRPEGVDGSRIESFDSLQPLPNSFNTLVSMTSLPDRAADESIFMQQREALFEAVEYGRIEIVQNLLEVSPSLANAKNSNGKPLLSLAVARGNNYLVHALLALEQLNFNAQDEAGRTALSSAIKQGNFVLARLMAKKKGVDCTLKDQDGMSSLLLSVQCRLPFVTRMLLNQSHIHHTDNNGKNLLHHAILSSNDDIIQYLLQVGLPAHSLDDNNRTPLSYAAEMGQSANIEILFSHASLDVNSVDDCGRTALSYAAERGQDAVVALLLEVPGINATMAAANGRTPLSYSCVHSLLCTFKIIISFDASPIDLPDVRGRTPLSWAASHGSAPVCRFLIEEGVEINFTDDDGRDPLSYAAEMVQPAIVRLLLETGHAAPTFMDNSRRSPLDYALSSPACYNEPFLDWQRFENRKWAVAWMLITGNLKNIPSVTSLDELFCYAISLDDKFSVSQMLISPLGNSIESPSDLVKYTFDHGTDEIVGVVLEALGGLGVGPSSIPILSFGAAARREALVNKFMRAGTESEEYEGVAPLAHAVINGQRKALRVFLFNDKTKVNISDGAGRTPLILASLHDRKKVLDCLLQTDGIDVNARDQDGRSAISHAAGCGHNGILKPLLADPRVDADLVDHQGRSPLWYAVSEWRYEAIFDLSGQS